MVAGPQQDGELEKTYSLFDLLCVGVGGTVGSGVFVLTGLIASESGPATPICFLIGGIGCIFSAASYAELSGKIPSTGSGYAYVYATLGEYPAFLAAACLSLEYGVASAAVAISWGDKLSLWFRDIWSVPVSASQPDHLNISASLLQLICVLILLAGIDVSKRFINILAVAKLVLVLIMIIAGLSLLQPHFLSVAAYKTVTMAGVLRGSTASFFAYLGYDEVCFLSSESKDPRVMPKAVFGTLGVTTMTYLLAATALAGMRAQALISSESGFTEAFMSHGGLWEGFAKFVALGELFTLPLVVLVTFMAQPRLQLAMALDGLIPSVFSTLDSRGNMANGIILSGVMCVLLALFIPFIYLEDVISAGVLLSFQMTNAALLVLRTGLETELSPPSSITFSPLSQASIHDDGDTRDTSAGTGTEADMGKMTTILLDEGDRWSPQLGRNPDQTYRPGMTARLLVCFHCQAMLMAWAVTQLGVGGSTAVMSLVTVACVVGCLGCLYFAKRIAALPRTDCRVQSPSGEDVLYEVPWMPYVPLIGTVINYLLLAQLKVGTAMFLLAFFLIATVIYLVYRYRQVWWRDSWWDSLSAMLSETDGWFQRRAGLWRHVDSTGDSASDSTRGDNSSPRVTPKDHTGAFVGIELSVASRLAP